MLSTETGTADLARAILRVADLIDTRMKTVGIYAEGAPITDSVLIYAMLPLDPTTAFDWDLWQEAFRQTRRDGTRAQVKDLHDELRKVLIAELGGDIGVCGTGTRYTPTVIREVAYRFSPTLRAS